MSKIRIATIGAGFGQSAHVQYFSLPETEHIGVLRKHGNSSGGFSSLEDLIAAKPDIVTIAVQPNEQLPLVERLLAGGISKFFLEKPLAENYSSAEKLVRLIREKKANAVVSFQLLELPSLKLFRSLLEQYFANQILTIDFVWHGKSRLFQDGEWNWKADKTLGGGVLPILGSHFIYTALSLFGDFSLKTTFASNQKTIALKNSNPNLAAIDSVKMDLAFANGHKGSMDLSNSTENTLMQITVASGNNKIIWRNPNKSNFKGFEVILDLKGESKKMYSSNEDQLPLTMKSRFLHFLNNQTEGLELALLAQEKIDAAANF